MLNPVTWYVEAAQRWAWKGVSVLALVTSVAAIAVVYSEAPAEVGLPLPETVHVVPATGEQGFPVETFCEDDATEVRVTFIPDGGPGYELQRTKDGVTELVTWNSVDHTNTSALYYPGGSLTEGVPAFITEGASNCIQEKAK